MTGQVSDTFNIESKVIESSLMISLSYYQLAELADIIVRKLKGEPVKERTDLYSLVGGTRMGVSLSPENLTELAHLIANTKLHK